METQVVPIIRKELDRRKIKVCLSILDSAKSHTTATVISAFWANKMPAAVIPAGMTAFIQWVDVYFAAAYRRAHENLYRRWANNPTRKTAAQKRRLLSVLVGMAAKEVTSSESITRQFMELGYLRAGVELKKVRGAIIPLESFDEPTLALDRESFMKRLQEEEAKKEREKAGNKKASILEVLNAVPQTTAPTSASATQSEEEHFRKLKQTHDAFVRTAQGKAAAEEQRKEREKEAKRRNKKEKKEEKKRDKKEKKSAKKRAREAAVTISDSGSDSDDVEILSTIEVSDDSDDNAETFGDETFVGSDDDNANAI